MSFSSGVRRFAQKAGRNSEKVVTGVVMELSGAIIGDTPVGNPKLWKHKAPKGYVGGAARGNWFASVGEQKIDTDDARTEAEALAQVTLASVSAPGNTYHLTNNLPYIIPLEYEGHSGQQPEGMVRVNADNFQKIVRQKANSV